ncbi:MAG: hypothetical protein E6R04_04960 [Spirochaetes bacterium]|jgi:hypothetical protein|nr:MAG: hypothetical protein E6R04_04960 [Spirochaetota bacterium]
MSDESEFRTAFCPLLFEANGGAASSAVMNVVGKCNKPYDCLECPLMQEWIKHLSAQGFTMEWECDQCIKNSFTLDLDNHVERAVPGFFQGSRFRGFPDSYELSDPGRVLDGCTTCGFGSPILQLVIRRVSK